MAYKFEFELEMKTPSDKIWNNLMQFATVIPKVMPEVYEKVEVVEGDGKTVGTVFATTYKPELNYSMKTSKERIASVDEEKKILSLEMEVLNFCEKFNATVCVSSRSNDDGSLVKYSAELDKAINAQVPDVLKNFIIKMFQRLDAYLQKA